MGDTLRPAFEWRSTDSTDAEEKQHGQIGTPLIPLTIYTGERLQVVLVWTVTVYRRSTMASKHSNQWPEQETLSRWKMSRTNRRTAHYFSSDMSPTIGREQGGCTRLG